MASMIDRMDDVQFGIKTPLCQMCMNKINRKFNPKMANLPIFACAVLGEVPLDLCGCERFKCAYFKPNTEDVDVYYSILTREQKDYVDQVK